MAVQAWPPAVFSNFWPLSNGNDSSGNGSSTQALITPSLRQTASVPPFVMEFNSDKVFSKEDFEEFKQRLPRGAAEVVRVDGETTIGNRTFQAITHEFQKLLWETKTRRTQVIGGFRDDVLVQSADRSPEMQDRIRFLLHALHDINNSIAQWLRQIVPKIRSYASSRSGLNPHQQTQLRDRMIQAATTAARDAEQQETRSLFSTNVPPSSPAQAAENIYLQLTNPIRAAHRRLKEIDTFYSAVGRAGATKEELQRLAAGKISFNSLKDLLQFGAWGSGFEKLWNHVPGLMAWRVDEGAGKNFLTGKGQIYLEKDRYCFAKQRVWHPHNSTRTPEENARINENIQAARSRAANLLHQRSN